MLCGLGRACGPESPLPVISAGNNKDIRMVLRAGPGHLDDLIAEAMGSYPCVAAEAYDTAAAVLIAGQPVAQHLATQALRQPADKVL